MPPTEILRKILIARKASWTVEKVTLADAGKEIITLLSVEVHFRNFVFPPLIYLNILNFLFLIEKSKIKFIQVFSSKITTKSKLVKSEHKKISPKFN